MTLVTTPKLIWPELPLGATTIGPSFDTWSTTTAKRAYLLEAAVTGTVTGFSFKLGSVVLGCTVEVRMETIGSGGHPSGTLWNGSNSNITVVIADEDDNAWKTVTFTGAGSVNKNDKFAIVLQYSSGVTPNMNFPYYTTATYPVAYPCVSTYNGETWSVQTTTSNFPILVQYGSGIYPQKGAMPGLGQSTSYNNTSTPDLRGMRITFPFSGIISGFLLSIDPDGPFDVNFYASDGVTVLGTYSIANANLPPTGNIRLYEAEFNTPIPVTKDTNYYFAVEPMSSTNLNFCEVLLGNTTWIAATAFLSSVYAQYASAKDPTNAASWTEDNTKLPNMALVFSAIDNGSTANLLGGKVR